MRKLDANQIHYLREVLGLQAVVLPTVFDAEIVGDSSISDDRAVVSEWRSSGDENAARIIVLIASETASYPLTDEAGDLTYKMIQAMKFDSSEVFILEWNHAHTPAPAEILQTLIRTAKPVLIFGAKTARSLMGHFPTIGEWSSWEGVRFVATESPADLLQRPELKRVAWTHMQTFMKGLSFG